MALNIISSAGKVYLLVKGVKYRETRTLRDGIFWACCYNDCKSWIKTNCEKTKITDSEIVHKHKSNLNNSASKSSNSKGSGSNTPRSQPMPTAPSLPTTLVPECSLAKSETPTTTPAPAKSNSPQLTSSTPSRFPSDLETENHALRENLTTLRQQLKEVLDHSIESDMRLLQYTDQVFAVPKGTSSKCQSTQTQEENTLKQNSDQCQQSNDVLLPEEDEEKVELKKMNTRLQDKLSVAIMKVKALEEELNNLKRPCTLCNNLLEITNSMKNTIHTLEEENKTLRHDCILCNIGNQTKQTQKTINSLSYSHDKGNEEDFVEVKKRKKPRKSKQSKNIHFNTHNKAGKYTNAPSSPKLPNIGAKTCALPFKTIEILGDSHARHLDGILMERVNSTTRIRGVCKPGAGLEQVAPTYVSPASECYVLIAGANDVAAGRQRVIYQYLEEVVKQYVKTSLVLVATLPYRYDLPVGSPVNDEVEFANHYIAELCSRYEGVELLDINTIGRTFFTKHGLHLRMRGKRLLADMITTSLSGSQRTSPLPSATAAASVPVPAVPAVSSPDAAVTVLSGERAAASEVQPLFRTFAEAVTSDLHVVSSSIKDNANCIKEKKLNACNPDLQNIPKLKNKKHNFLEFPPITSVWE